MKNECKEIDDATKEAGKRNKKDIELTYKELYPIVAQRIFDAQWEAYRNDRTIDTVYRQKKRPRFRNLEEFEKAFDSEIDTWRAPDHPGDANYAQKQVRELEREKKKFLDVVEAETNFQCGEQIVGLKYIPKKLILRGSNEKRTTIRAHWAGQLQDGQEHLLNSDWVESFILESIQNYIKARPHKFIRLPAGSNRNIVGPIEPLPGRWIPPPRPKVKYQQGKMKTCVYDSLASCLNYHGCDELAQFVHERAIRYSYSVDNIRALRSTIETYLGKKCYVKKITGSIDLLNLSPELGMYPIIVVLQGHDGNCEHAISILGNWIFDSNLPEALPLTRNSLDWCVMGKFKKVVEGLQFIL